MTDIIVGTTQGPSRVEVRPDGIHVYMRERFGTWRECWMCSAEPNHYTLTFWGQEVHYCPAHTPPFPQIQKHDFDVEGYLNQLLDKP